MSSETLHTFIYFILFFNFGKFKQPLQQSTFIIIKVDQGNVGQVSLLRLPHAADLTGVCFVEEGGTGGGGGHSVNQVSGVI